MNNCAREYFLIQYIKEFDKRKEKDLQTRFSSQFTSLICNTWSVKIQGALCSLDSVHCFFIMDLENAFRKNINTLKLYLNFQGELDKKIISECNILLDLLPQITILSTDGVVDAKPSLQFLDAQDKILMLSQIYLKSEWSRVKYENRIVKWPGKYWDLFKGFKETKLVNDLTTAFNHEVAHYDRRRTELNFFGIRRD